MSKVLLVGLLVLGASPRSEGHATHVSSLALGQRPVTRPTVILAARTSEVVILEG